VTILELSANGGGSGIVKNTTLLDGDDSWEEFFQYRELEMKVHELETEVADLRDKLSEMIHMFNNVQFISSSDGFATYIPRNRRGSE